MVLTPTTQPVPTSRRASAKLIAVTGLSGAGKTTFAAHLESAVAGLIRQVSSATTRPARRCDPPGTAHLTRREFSTAARRGELVALTRVGTHRYGLPARRLDAAIAEGQVPVVVVDASGVRELKRRYGTAAVSAVYLDAPADRWGRLVRRDGIVRATARRILEPADQPLRRAADTHIPQTAQYLKTRLVLAAAGLPAPTHTSNAPTLDPRD